MGNTFKNLQVPVGPEEEKKIKEARQKYNVLKERGQLRQFYKLLIMKGLKYFVKERDQYRKK